MGEIVPTNADRPNIAVALLRAAQCMGGADDLEILLRDDVAPRAEFE